MAHYSITISVNTYDELVEKVEELSDSLYRNAPIAEPQADEAESLPGAPRAVAAAAPEAPKRKRGRPAKAKPAPETQNDEGEVEAATDAAPETQNDEGEPETTRSAEAAEPATEAVENAAELREELRAVLTALHKEKGLNFVVRVLQQFNADRVSSVRGDLLAKAIAEAQQYLAQK